MPLIQRVILDVLKPHQPNVLEFASALAERHVDCLVKVTVIEIDEKTETILLQLESDDIPFEAVVESIKSLGASVHSIDEVQVSGKPRAK